MIPVLSLTLTFALSSSSSLTWPTFTPDNIAKINFHKICQQPGESETENYSTILNFFLLFLLLLSMFLLRGNFWDFQIFCVSCRFCIKHNLTYTHNDDSRAKSRRTWSIFSTTRMMMAVKQWSGKKIIFIMLIFSCSSIPGAQQRQFMVMRIEQGGAREEYNGNGNLPNALFLYDFI